MKKIMFRMMTWYIGCLWTILMTMSGCKTSEKETTASVSNQMRLQEYIEMSRYMNENLSAAFRESSASWSQQLWDLNAKWNRTVFTPPDSTGKQYIQSEEQLDTKASGEKQRKDTVYVDFRLDVIRNEIFRLNTRLDSIQSIIRNIHEENKRHITWYQAILQFLGLCAVIYIVCRIFIRKVP